MTLIELLVVIAIIGLITAVSLPALKGIGQANTMASASRQLIDDIALARQMAINNRASVYMLFMGPVPDNTVPSYLQFAAPTPTNLANNLLKRQFVGYSIYAERTIGDQPGQTYPRYLTGWRTLPDGIFIPLAKFNGAPPYPAPMVNGVVHEIQPFQPLTPAEVRTFPYPQDGTALVPFYYLKFGPSGAVDSICQSPDGQVTIPLCRGGIMLDQDATGGLRWTPASPMERPAGNWLNNPSLVVIDGPTGRTRLEKPELQ